MRAMELGEVVKEPPSKRSPGMSAEVLAAETRRRRKTSGSDTGVETTAVEDE